MSTVTLWACCPSTSGKPLPPCSPHGTLRRSSSTATGKSKRQATAPSCFRCRSPSPTGAARSAEPTADQAQPVHKKRLTTFGNRSRADTRYPAARFPQRLHAAEEKPQKKVLTGLDVSEGFCIITHGSGDSQIRRADQGIHGRVCRAITRS